MTERHSPTIDQKSDGTWAVNCAECSEAAKDYVRCPHLAAWPVFLHERPVPAWQPDRPDGIESAVFQALGAASTCWESMSGTGVFDDTRAREIGDGLVAWLMDNM